MRRKIEKQTLYFTSTYLGKNDKFCLIGEATFISLDDMSPEIYNIEALVSMHLGYRNGQPFDTGRLDFDCLTEELKDEILALMEKELKDDRWEGAYL